MVNLCKALGEFSIYEVSRVVGRDHGYVEKEKFLHAYSLYIQALCEGLAGDALSNHSIFSTIFTRSSEFLYAMPVGETGFLVKPTLPVIQLQTHAIIYGIDGQFRSVARGKNTISWGLQFSFPQIYKDPKTKSILNTSHHPASLNRALFLTLSQWVRENSVPTPILPPQPAPLRKIYLPMRIGKRCFAWINRHCDLQRDHLQICPLTQPDGKLTTS
jgi:hypothetical protein